jgi:quercetin dioxygenase-like cupin family protein
VKEPTFRVILMHLATDHVIERHSAPGALGIQVLSGHVRIHAEGRSLDAPAGTMIVLEAGIEHDVQALQTTTLLLTIAWPTENK